MTLKDGTGFWLSRETLTNHITDAFKKLFMATTAHMRTMTSLGPYFHHNSPFLDHSQSLSSIPQPTEILKNVLSLPPLKAPKPDGYHTLFFQNNWHILRLSMIQVIQEIFENLTILPD